MPTYRRIFVIADIANVHREFQLAIVECARVNSAARARGQRAPAEAIERQLRREHAVFQARLDAIAVATSTAATQSIQRRLKATARRSATGEKPGIHDLIRSRPIPRIAGFSTGAVGVADEAWLNKAIDPDYPQHGTYWLAQEEGTSKHIGRVITGYFGSPGFADIEVPRAAYAGGRGPHPVFSPLVVGPRGGRGGPGTIRHPIHARHFVRDGANIARGTWHAELRQLEAATIKHLAAVLTGTVPPRRRGRPPRRGRR